MGDDYIASNEPILYLPTSQDAVWTYGVFVHSLKADSASGSEEQLFVAQTASAESVVEHQCGRSGTSSAVRQHVVEITAKRRVPFYLGQSVIAVGSSVDAEMGVG